MLLSAPPLAHTPAGEGAAHHVHRFVLELAEHAQRRAAQVGAGTVAAVADEPRVDHLEPPAPDEDRAAPAALGPLAGGVAVGERQVLHGELRVVLVLAVRGGEALRLVAGVHVEDAALAAAAERDLAAAVQHDARAVRVHHLGGGLHGDGDRRGPAVEGDDAAGRDGLHHRLGGAARRGAAADGTGRARGVHRTRLGRHARPAGGVAGAERHGGGGGARPGAAQSGPPARGREGDGAAAGPAGEPGSAAGAGAGSSPQAGSVAVARARTSRVTADFTRTARC